MARTRTVTEWVRHLDYRYCSALYNVPSNEIHTKVVDVVGSGVEEVEIWWAIGEVRVALVLYSCGCEVLSIWPSLALQSFLQTLGRNFLVPLKIKKCLGIVLDKLIEPARILTKYQGPTEPQQDVSCIIDFYKIHFYVEGVAVVLIISQCSPLSSFITLQL